MLWQVLAKYGVPDSLNSVNRKLCRDVNGIGFSFKSLSGVKRDPSRFGLNERVVASRKTET
jgi:hypothetical protein